MKTAVVTMVYNESVNLPIWLRYYAACAGEENLFVADHGSTDGSTRNLGEANRIRLPRTDFDEFRKTDFVSALCRGLLQYYDTVIYTDCDEIIVPDLRVYADLNDYLTRKQFDYVSCVGLNVLHIISQEDPLDLSLPILPQRRYAAFRSATCKPLVTRIPLTWANGFHTSDKPPNIDPQLFMFHTKVMDYTVSLQRHKVNREAKTSQRQIDRGFGSHWRFDNERFVREAFFDPLNVLSHGGVAPFDFTEEIARISGNATESSGVHFIPMDIVKMVEIPEFLKSAF